MREPFARMFVHLVWATWDRLPLITPAIQPRIYPCIQSEVHRMNAQAIAIGGIEDHVHVLVKYPPSLAISDLLKQMKGVLLAAGARPDRAG